MSAIDELIATVARLRAPGGCPWDREQTHRSLCAGIIEETAEFLETVDLDEKKHMCEELGDLLLQIVMHAQIASETGDFTFDDVARGVNEKMIRRHPHVFGTLSLKDSAAVLKKWDEIKSHETNNSSRPQPNSPFKNAPAALSALFCARDVWKAVKKNALDAGDEADCTKIDALAATLDEASAGTALFEIVAACRQVGIDPESALRRKTLAVRRACEKNLKISGSAAKNPGDAAAGTGNAAAGAENSAAKPMI